MPVCDTHVTASGAQNNCDQDTRSSPEIHASSEFLSRRLSKRVLDLRCSGDFTISAGAHHYVVDAIADFTSQPICTCLFPIYVRHLAALRLLSTWFDIKWIKMRKSIPRESQKGRA